MNDEKSSDDSQQTEFKKYWLEVKQQAQEKCVLGSELSKDAAWEMDIADAHLRAADRLPGITGITGLSAYPQRLSLEQRRQLDGLRQYIDYSGTAVASSASVSATYSVLSGERSDYTVFGFEVDAEFEVEAIKTELTTLITRHDRKEEVLGLMRKLGFEERERGRNAMHQFGAAWEEHERLSPSPTAPLLTMRAALLFAVDELLERRPNRSGKANQRTKVTKIGEQLSASGITAADYERLQEEYDLLYDKLSEHKAPKGDRGSWLELLMRSTLFLSQLLHAVDPTKMRA